MKFTLPVVALAVAGVAASAAPASAATTIKVRAHTTHFKMTHGGKVFDFKDKLTDLKTKAVVGHDHVVCTMKSKDVLSCKATFTFDRGKLKVKGDVPQNGNSSVPITGGTGKYAGASGTLKLRDAAHDDTYLTFKID